VEESLRRQPQVSQSQSGSDSTIRRLRRWRRLAKARTSPSADYTWNLASQARFLRGPYDFVLGRIGRSSERRPYPAKYLSAYASAYPQLYPAPCLRPYLLPNLDLNLNLNSGPYPAPHRAPFAASFQSSF